VREDWAELIQPTAMKSIVPNNFFMLHFLKVNNRNRKRQQGGRTPSLRRHYPVQVQRVLSQLEGQQPIRHPGNSVQR
jgi:hypothetical protein